LLCKVEEWRGALAEWNDETKWSESEREAGERSEASGSVAVKSFSFLVALASEGWQAPKGSRLSILRR